MNGIHNWYGTPTNDVSYCQTIWKFFSQYSKQTSVISSIRNNSASEHFTIYPNPSFGNFTIDLSAINQKKIALTIYDLLGKIVYVNTSIPSEQIQIENQFSSGIYIVQIIGENGIISSQKIVIE
ncbi:MAG: T9SS type A sorting domain-containing protein [Saprospirales bacterium]|nr:T9SS type A sorting domain-containing protein [Saprospirales bacterium]